MNLEKNDKRHILQPILTNLKNSNKGKRCCALKLVKLKLSVIQLKPVGETSGVF